MTDALSAEEEARERVMTALSSDWARVWATLDAARAERDEARAETKQAYALGVYNVEQKKGQACRILGISGDGATTRSPARASSAASSGPGASSRAKKSRKKKS